jgi:predicted nucleic acid-binding protein
VIALDASTLILIARVELLDVFLDDSKLEVFIPVEVEKKCCCAVKKSFDALMIQKAVQESKIKVIEVKNKKLVAKLRGDFGIGRGEAEAIALAVAERAQIVGIDDKNGINACKLLGIPFTTAIGILTRMREKHLLTVSAAVAKLTALGKHGRYKQSILDDARQRLEATA